MPVTHTPRPKGVSDVVSNLLQPSLTSHFDVLIGLPQKKIFLSQTKEDWQKMVGI